MSIPRNLNIWGSCRIKKGQAWTGETIFFQQEDAAAAVFLTALYKALQVNYPKWYKMDRLSQLGILAAELLFRDAGLPEGSQPVETAIVLANSHSSLDTDTRFTAQLEEIPSPAVFVYTLPNIVIGEISIRYGIKGEQAFYLMEKPDMEFLHQYVQALFAEGQTKYCIVGWLDLFREEYEAVLFLVGSQQGSAAGKVFNKENLYQYLYHEQGAVS
ncbi:beta-ketoacyl synthase N-terminal-like domain-containing protein [Flavihumibacter fluvii]|uniref:beta-ketoacyl synthase N-terminal-like domain-containing protein n=1 Tax=Flavihumibacter fluvii TaxID=2838157 RepID=UPI001BDEA0F7|nr:beta-ketoacyl synthase N-terminal-like domain-containing protein [Flavihumibacter fluvii]ULQ51473.1 hypothetical protein KJS93_15400 [Flavihumibacter fluvii]